MTAFRDGPNGGRRSLPPERVQRRVGRRQPAAQHKNSGLEVCLRASLTSINNSGEGLKFMEMQIIERRMALDNLLENLQGKKEKNKAQIILPN